MMPLGRMRQALKGLARHQLEPLSRASGLALTPPREVFLEITDRCCLRCRQCDMWKNYSREPGMSTAEKMRVIDELQAWLGSFRLNFTGGEPLLKADELLLLAAHATSLGIETSTNSNGWPLDDQLVVRLARSGLGSLILSVDSTDPQKHDHIRGVAGSHRRVVEALERLLRLEEGPAVSVSAILMGYTAAEMPDLAAWAAEKGVQGIGFQALDSNASFLGKDRGEDWWRQSELFAGEQEVIERAIETLVAMKRGGYPITNSFRELRAFQAFFREPQSFDPGPCYTGVKNLFINKRGKVWLCSYMPPIGRLGNGLTLSEIWRGGEAASVRREIRGCRRNCALNACNKRQLLRERKRALRRLLRPAAPRRLPEDLP